MKHVYSYQEIAHLIEQGKFVACTPQLTARITAVQPGTATHQSGDSYQVDREQSGQTYHAGYASRGFSLALPAVCDSVMRKRSVIVPKSMECSDPVLKELPAGLHGKQQFDE